MIEKFTAVGVDMDGVMYPFAHAMHKHCEAHVRFQELKKPDSWDFYKPWGVTSEEFSQVMRDASTSHNLFSSEPPIHLVTDGWILLKQSNVKIHIITARPKEAWSQTIDWLSRYEMMPDSLHFTSRKAIIRHLAAGRVAAIDDNTGFYKDLKSNGVHAFLCTQPWNAELEEANRAESFFHFAENIFRNNLGLEMK